MAGLTVTAVLQGLSPRPQADESVHGYRRGFLQRQAISLMEAKNHGALRMILSGGSVSPRLALECVVSENPQTTPLSSEDLAVFFVNGLARFFEVSLAAVGYDKEDIKSIALSVQMYAERTTDVVRFTAKVMHWMPDALRMDAYKIEDTMKLASIIHNAAFELGATKGEIMKMAQTMISFAEGKPLPRAPLDAPREQLVT